METLVFIEELGRYGDVTRRHCIKRIPARIGRSYATDVLLDDPYVEAQHLEIRQAADGTLEVIDLGSLNGTHRLGKTESINAMRLHGDEVLRIGHTQLRIRLPGHLVPSALALPQRAWDRNPWVFAVSAGLTICLVAWSQYVKTFTTDLSDIYIFPISISILLLVWAAIWSLVCRTLHGAGNFLAHGIIIFLGLAVLSCVYMLTEYIDFAFELGGLGLVGMIGIALVIAGILYRHLRLTVRLSPRILGALSVSIVATIFASLVVLESILDADKPGLQAYDTSIKPGIFLFTQGIAPEQFFDIAQQLKTKTDKETMLP